MSLVLHGLVDCLKCGETYEGVWTDEGSDTVQDMDGAPVQDQACLNCGHVQEEIWPGWAFRSEAGLLLGGKLWL